MKNKYNNSSIFDILILYVKKNFHNQQEQMWFPAFVIKIYTYYRD